MVGIGKALIAVAGLPVGVGCGDGHDPSNHKHPEAKSVQTAEKVKDSVCGMTIDKSAAKAHEEYKGGHY